MLGEAGTASWIFRLPIGAAVLSAEGVILEVSERLCHLVESSRADLVGKRLIDLLESPAFLKNSEPAELLPGSRTEQVLELTGKTRGGRDIWFQITVAPFPEMEGGSGAHLVLFQDISYRRRQLEEEYRKQEALTALLDHSPDFIARIGPDFRFQFANRAAAQIMGIFQGAIAGRTLEEACFPRQAAAFWQEWLSEVFESGVEKQVESLLGPLLVLRHFESRLVPERSPQGAVISVLIVAREITLRKRIEEALTAQTENLTVTLHALSEGVIGTDAAGRVTLLNRVAEELTGYSQEEALGRPLLEWMSVRPFQGSYSLAQILERSLFRGETVRPERDYELTSRQGSRFQITAGAAPIRSSGGAVLGAVIVFQNVTARRRMEEELLRTSKLESIARLAGGIAHDFNNMLTAILGNLALARLSIEDSDPLAMRLTAAESAADRGRELTQQLLTFARGGEPIRKEADLSRLLTDSARAALRGTDVGFRLDVAPNLWRVRVDPGQLGKAVHNLVVNARQAQREHGEILLKVENRDLSDPGELPLDPGRFVVVRIIDQGEGIPEENRNQVFDPFFTTRPQGAGLGLPAAYSIIRRHGGFLKLESVEGSGTTAVIFLQAEETAAVPVEPLREPVLAGPARILVMDDEVLIREVVALFLRRQGYEVVEAERGEDAIEVYQEALDHGHRFDLVIMDLTIPEGMGGAEAISRLRVLDPAVRAIVASGYSSDPVMARCQEYGFRAALPKPFRMAELSTVVAEVLAPPPGGEQKAAAG